MALTGISSTRDFVRTWFFWKTQALVVLVVIVGVVMAFSYIITPEYDSTAKILVLPSTSDGLIVAAAMQRPQIVPVTAEDVNTEMELLTSDAVARETVKSFGKGSLGLRSTENAWYDKVLDPIKKSLGQLLLFLKLREKLSPFEANVQLLKNSLTVEPAVRSNIILVTLRSESPKAAEVILNRLLEIYIRHHNDVFSKTEGLQFYRDQEIEYRKKLGIAEENLKAFHERGNIVELKAENEANIELLSDLTNDLKQIEIAYDAARTKMNLLRKALKESKKGPLVTEEMRTIPAIIELEKGLVPLLIRRSEILKTYTPSSREYENINGQIQILRGEIKDEVMKAIEAEELETEALLNKKQSLRAKIDELKEEAKKLSRKKIKEDNLKTEVNLNRDAYILYAAKTQDERIYQERKKRDLANVCIASLATIPIEPAFPNRLLMLLISLFVGMFAALGAPFFLEFLDHRIKTAEDAEDLLGLPVISAIPETRN